MDTKKTNGLKTMIYIQNSFIFILNFLNQNNRNIAWELNEFQQKKYNQHQFYFPWM